MIENNYLSVEAVVTEETSQIDIHRLRSCLMGIVESDRLARCETKAVAAQRLGISPTRMGRIGSGDTTVYTVEKLLDLVAQSLPHASISLSVSIPRSGRQRDQHDFVVQPGSPSTGTD